MKPHTYNAITTIAVVASVGAAILADIFDSASFVAAPVVFLAAVAATAVYLRQHWNSPERKPKTRSKNQLAKAHEKEFKAASSAQTDRLVLQAYGLQRAALVAQAQNVQSFPSRWSFDVMESQTSLDELVFRVYCLDGEIKKLRVHDYDLTPRLLFGARPFSSEYLHYRRKSAASRSKEPVQGSLELAHMH